MIRVRTGRSWLAGPAPWRLVALLVFAPLSVAPWLVAQPAAAQEPASPAPLAMEDAMVAAIAKAEKSVVAIARVRRQDDEPLDFSVNRFGRVLEPQISSPGTPEFIPNEYATGVVVGAKGEILTAHHVLQEDCDYWVTTPERKIYKVSRVLGADPRSDLAVLQIDATDLVPIEFGDATGLKKGQWVIALGNPYAIARDGQASASLGMVSNLMRKDAPRLESGTQSGKAALHQYGMLIQTDARLNLGTSGGALINLRGEMVGLTVALAATSPYEQSAGFAIPVDATFLRAVQTLKEGSEVEYGFLGVGVDSLLVEERKQGRHGVRVRSVVGSTPAARAGLRDQDIVTHVNGAEVFDQDQFMLGIGKLPVGASAILRVERDGRPLVLVVDELAKYHVAGNKVVTNPAPLWRGLRVDYVTASRHFTNWTLQGLVDPQGSVLVTEVVEGSAAWQEGLRPDMMISHVSGNRVSTPRQFLESVGRAEGPVSVQLNLPTGERPRREIPPDAG